MSSATFYGGINEIGGNKILIENKDTRIFLDFGQSFSHLDEFFVPEAYLFPRGRFGLRDYFALDLMPKLPGLYSQEALKHTDLEHGSPSFDGIFLSHPHQDHFSHLSYVDPSIPFFMGEITKSILESTQATTKAFIFSEEDWKKKDGTEVPANTVNTFRSGSKIKVGSMEVTPVHVDHSVPGAYGFLVDAGDSRIAYSGDLRRHGSRPELTADFISHARSFEPDLLIVEGTRVNTKEDRKSHTEPFVEASSRKVASESSGLVLGMRYPKDLDRFRTFYTVAKELGKELIISPKTAHLLLALKDDPIELPNPLEDSSIKIFSRAKLRYEAWERELAPHAVDTDYISSRMNEVILELDSYYMTELVDIKPACGDLIHSMSEPFEEDPVSGMVDTVLHNWADRFGMEYHQFHASGHASKEEIFSIVEEVGARRIVPIHTKNAKLFRETKKEIVEVVNGGKVIL